MPTWPSYQSFPLEGAFFVIFLKGKHHVNWIANMGMWEKSRLYGSSWAVDLIYFPSIIWKVLLEYFLNKANSRAGEQHHLFGADIKKTYLIILQNHINIT